MSDSDWLREAQFFDEGFRKKLPDPNKKNVLITSALPYVNNVPHLGNIIGSTLSADVFSRYCRLRGYQSLYICGTDEYGTATEMKALKEGVMPQEICDKFHKLHKDIYEWFGIEFDYFGRTTTKHQTEITQDIFMKIHKSGYTSTSALEQLHCNKCNKFLADRYVFGTCPHCKFDDARGDQCDSCGKLLDAVDLVQPKCHICSSTPELKHSEHIFIDLNRLSDDVEKHFNTAIKKKDHHWSQNSISIVRSWLKLGLEKRCITRDLKWGTPVPLKEFASKVFYVWFDAPIGYLSMTKTLLGDDWVKWWKNPEQVELYQFLGKDNVAFHAVIFPATQIATGENYTRVSHICATEYLNYEDKKFSKSRGVGVFGDSVAQTGIPADVWRFYLIYMRPESQDTAFSWDDFFLKVNSELISNMANFINRGLMFIKKFYDSLQPDVSRTTAENEYICALNTALAAFTEDLENVKLRDALMKVLVVSRLGNQYMQANKPWELIKGSEEDKKKAGNVVGMISNTVVLLSVMLYPFMPKISAEIRRQCNIDKCIRLPPYFIRFLKPGHKFNEPAPIVERIEPALVQILKKRFNSTADQEPLNNDGETANQQKQKGRNSKEKKSAPVNAPVSDAKMSETNDKGKTLKDSIAKLFADNGDIQALQKQIEAVYVNVEKDLEAAKKAFIARELPKVEAENAKLKEEITKLQKKLGYVRLTGVETPSSETSEKEVAKTAEASKTAKKEKLAKAEKVSKSDKGVAATVEDEVDIGRLDLRVGRILEAKKHPDADALYIETIDLGEEQPRTVVSGLVRFVPLEQMQNRLVICVCNLKPVKMRGIESQAMVLCASTPEKVEIVEVDPGCKPGDRLTCEPAFATRPDPVLNPKKKIWETVAVDLKVSESGEVVYKNEVLKVNGSCPIRAPTLRNVPVK